MSEQGNLQNQQNQSELEQARAKLACRMGDLALTGGKGTQRRKKKVVHKASVSVDKNLKSVLKKQGAQPFPNIDEVNMFKDDKTVLHFEKPEVMTSLQNNTMAIFGNHETKTIKELLPDILTQLGSKQYGALQDILLDSQKDKIKKGEENKTELEESNDEIPLLKENVDFEEVSKVE